MLVPCLDPNKCTISIYGILQHRGTIRHGCFIGVSQVCIPLSVQFWALEDASSNGKDRCAVYYTVEAMLNSTVSQL